MRQFHSSVDRFTALINQSVGGIFSANTTNWQLTTQNAVRKNIIADENIFSFSLCFY